MFFGYQNATSANNTNFFFNFVNGTANTSSLAKHTTSSVYIRSTDMLGGNGFGANVSTSNGSSIGPSKTVVLNQDTYLISEVDMHVGEPVTIEDVTYEFGTPMISEDEEKFTYEIPTTITNDSHQPIGVDYENLIIYSKYLVQNGIALDEVMNHPKNEDSTAVLNGVPPGEKDEIMLMFFLYKNWKIEKDTNIDMYYRYIRGDTVVKYKLPVNY